MIKIKLNAQKDLQLSMQVLEMDEKYREGVIFNGSNGFSINSLYYPTLRHSVLFLRGNATCKDNKVFTRKFNTKQEKEDYIQRMMETINEYNAQGGDLQVKWVMPRARAKYREYYYCVNHLGEIIKCTEDNLTIDTNRFEIGNYFLAKEEAKIYSKKVLAVFEERIV